MKQRAAIMQTFEQLQTLGALSHIYKARSYRITSFESSTNFITGNTNITLQFSKSEFITKTINIRVYPDGRSEEFTVPTKDTQYLNEKYMRFLELAEEGKADEAKPILEELYHVDKFINEEKYKYNLANYGYDKELQKTLQQYLSYIR
ncbi:MAG: hypothetical protein HC932_05290 [Thermales bacterium]|nr:hypothetical protein [Thermales bacterium]